MVQFTLKFLFIRMRTEHKRAQKFFFIKHGINQKCFKIILNCNFFRIFKIRNVKFYIVVILRLFVHSEKEF